MTNKTSCQVEILNLDARVSVEFTKQDENMDHSADGATYKAKVNISMHQHIGAAGGTTFLGEKFNIILGLGGILFYLK